VQKTVTYKPPLHADEIGLTSDKYIALNATVAWLPLKLSYAPMSLQRWLLMQTMEHSLQAQSGVGFSDKDIDDVRRLISDTSVYLLAITLIASSLHLLFEFLAFQSDIAFWSGNKSLAGLSVRSVVTELFSQIIVFLFLVDSDTSLLVSVPAFAAILIQMWKVHKGVFCFFRLVREVVPPDMCLFVVLSQRWDSRSSGQRARGSGIRWCARACGTSKATGPRATRRRPPRQYLCPPRTRPRTPRDDPRPRC
jgi:hypothetical protein